MHLIIGTKKKKYVFFQVSLSIHSYLLRFLYISSMLSLYLSLSLLLFLSPSLLHYNQNIKVTNFFQRYLSTFFSNFASIAFLLIFPAAIICFVSIIFIYILSLFALSLLYWDKCMSFFILAQNYKLQISLTFEYENFFDSKSLLFYFH